MARFNYLVINNLGEKFRGTKEADSKENLFYYLSSKGFTVVSIEESLGIDFSKLFSQDIGGVPLKEKVILLKQLSTMISAGIPIIQALDLLVKQTEKSSLKNKLSNVYKSIEAGSSLSDGFGKVKGLLSEVQISLLAAGEKSGNLNRILEKISEDLEKNQKLRGKILGALIYPVVIFIVLIAVVILMITFMVPQVKELYSSLGQSDLPLPTEILISISNLFNNPISVLFILATIATLIVFSIYYNRTEKGREFFDRIKVKLPVFGSLSKKIEISQFSRILSMLLESGISILDAIEITKKALSNSLFQKVLSESKEEITKGSSLSVSITKFDKNNLFPEILIRIILVGEESGKLEKVLYDMGNFYESEVEQISANLTKLLEPFIMLVAGLVVMFLAFAVYTPTLQLIQNIA